MAASILGFIRRGFNRMNSEDLFCTKRMYDHIYNAALRPGRHIWQGTSSAKKRYKEELQNWSSA